MNGHVCVEQIFLERYFSISKKKQQHWKKDNIKQKSTVKKPSKIFDSWLNSWMVSIKKKDNIEQQTAVNIRHRNKISHDSMSEKKT